MLLPLQRGYIANSGPLFIVKKTVYSYSAAEPETSTV